MALVLNLIWFFLLAWMMLCPVPVIAFTGAPAPPIFSGGTGSAGTLYVSPGGSGITCSNPSPCSSSEGIDQATAGEIVLFKDGIYALGSRIETVRNGTSENHIILKAENQHQAIIQAPANGFGVIYIRHNYITVDGFKVEDTPYSGHGIAIENNGGVHHIIIENNWVFEAGRSCIKTWSSDASDTDIIIRDNLLDKCGLESSQDVANGIYLGRASSKGPFPQDRIIISGNEIREYAENCIDIKSNVSDLWAYDNDCHTWVPHTTYGATNTATDGQILALGNQNYIYNNRIFNINGENGPMFLVGRSDTALSGLVYNNLAYDSETTLLIRDHTSGSNAIPKIFNNTFFGLDGYDIREDNFTIDFRNNIGIDRTNNIPVPSSSYFIDAANGDFHLTSNATNAIDKATGDPVSQTDIEGTAVMGSFRDYGAYEFASMPSGPIAMNALQAAINAAVPGEVITVANGTYNNPGGMLIDHGNNCTQALPCTIQAETNGQWIITGNTSGFVVHGDWWIIKGLVVQNQTGHLNEAWFEMFSAQNVVVSDCRFTGQSGGWDFAFMFGNEPDVEQGLNITVQDCQFDNWVGADNWIFDWNVRGNNHVHTGLIWRRNHMHDLNFDAGSNLGANNLGNFVGRSGTDCDGLFEDNIWERISADTAQDNCFFHTKCSGLTFKNNIFRDSPECAIRLRQGYGNVLDGNTFENLDVDFNTAQVWVSGGNHQIVNNVFNPKGGSKTCLEFTEGCILASATNAECSTEPDPENDCHYIASSGTIVANNSFRGCDTDSVDLFENASSSLCDPLNVCPSSNVFENNIFSHDNGGVALRDRGCTIQTVDDNLFHLQGGATAGLQGTQALFDTPDFENAGGDNFNLQSGSPAIDEGHNVAGTTLDALDILGVARPQGVAYDFGAYEFASTDTTPACVPQNLTATPVSSSQIDLAWDACTDPDLQDYVVQVCVGAGCVNFATIQVVTVPFWSNTFLVPGTTYAYRVQSRDTSGNLSAFSARAEATPSNIYFIEPVLGADQAGCGVGIGAAACATWARLNADYTPAAGDIVYLLNTGGNNALHERVSLTAANSGTSANPLIFHGKIAGQAERGIIDGGGLAAGGVQALLDLNGIDWVEIRDLEVRNLHYNDEMGVRVRGGSANYKIVRPHVHDIGSAGGNGGTIGIGIGALGDDGGHTFTMEGSIPASRPDPLTYDCQIHGAYGSGIYIGNHNTAQGASTITNCAMWDAQGDINESDAVFLAAGSRNVTFTRSLVSNGPNGDTGMELGYGTTDCIGQTDYGRGHVITRSIFRDLLTENGGTIRRALLAIQGCQDDILVANNLLYGEGPGIAAYRHASNLKIYHNSFFLDTYAYRIWEQVDGLDVRNNAGVGCVGAACDDDDRVVHIDNETRACCQQNNHCRWESNAMAAFGTETALMNMDRSSFGTFVAGCLAVAPGQTNTKYPESGLGTWKAVGWFGAASRTNDSSWGQVPLWVDPQARNFRLQASDTTALNKGQIITAVPIDFDGNARDSTPDIGAFEFLGTPTGSPGVLIQPGTYQGFTLK